jgi:hypothetical protein
MSGRIRVSKKELRTIDGITFASKAEMYRYAELKMLERTGVISELALQPRFILQEKFVASDGRKEREIIYVADFQYEKNGKTIVEDCKGMRTDVYKMKRKMFLKLYPQYVFRETKAK